MDKLKHIKLFNEHNQNSKIYESSKFSRLLDEYGEDEIIAQIVAVSDWKTEDLIGMDSDELSDIWYSLDMDDIVDLY